MQPITIVIVLAAWVWLGWEHRQLSRALRRRTPPPPSPSRYPSLTIVRPIRGLMSGVH